jgi:hypothetical protein
MQANDNEPLAEGDRVRYRRFPHIQGEVWSIERGMILMKWDDPEEIAEVRDPKLLEKIIRPLRAVE